MNIVSDFQKSGLIDITKMKTSKLLQMLQDSRSHQDIDLIGSELINRQSEFNEAAYNSLQGNSQAYNDMHLDSLRMGV